MRQFWQAVDNTILRPTVLAAGAEAPCRIAWKTRYAQMQASLRPPSFCREIRGTEFVSV